MTSHAIAWSSDGYNGLMDWLGKDKGTTTWAHPETTRSLVTTAQSSTLSGMVSSRALNQATDTSSGRSHTTDTEQLPWWYMKLTDAVITPTHFSVRSQNHNNGMETKFLVEGSLDGVSWDVLGETATTVTNNAWYSLAVADAGPYQYFRIMRYEASAHLIIGEVEVWGEYDDTVPSAGYAGDAEFAYNPEGGHNGLIQWLGSDKDFDNGYSNPDTNSGDGIDLITSSLSGQLNLYYSYKAFNRSYADAERAHSTNVENSWWKIDVLEGNTFKPTGLVIQSGVLGTNIRNFRVEGSNNDSDWTELYDVPDDSTGPDQGGDRFPIDLSSASTGYRYLRIYQYGLDSSDSTQYVTIGNIEFYGTFNPTASPGGSESAASSLESDAFQSYLIANESTTSGELVGVLNEINGTVGIEYAEARQTYLDSL